MKAAADAANCGVSPREYLTARDPVEQIALDVVAELAVERQHKLIEHQAALIARAVWGGS